jgi:hypothetical protein
MPKSSSLHRWLYGLGAAVLVCVLAAFGHTEAQAQQQKPNILVIFGDDIGQSNISAYTFGLMGYKTPNIDFDDDGDLVGMRYANWKIVFAEQRAGACGAHQLASAVAVHSRQHAVGPSSATR